MIDFETFYVELHKVKKNISKISLGSFSGYIHSTETQIHKFKCIDLYVPDLGFIHIVARDSYKLELLIQLVKEFERTRIKRYKKSILHVYKAQNLDKFDCYGLAPPALVKAHEFYSEILPKNGYQLFPMHGIEFLNKFSSEQFWTQRRRRDKWRVCILDWNRRIESY